MIALAGCSAPVASTMPTVPPQATAVRTILSTVTPVPPTPTALPTSVPTATIRPSVKPTSTLMNQGDWAALLDDYEIGVLQLRSIWQGRTLQVVYTKGERSPSPTRMLLVEKTPVGWSELGQFTFERAAWVESVNQVSLTSDRIWLEVHSIGNPHPDCYDLLSFDGATLHSEVSFCAPVYDAGYLKDLNEDGIPEAVLNRSDNYVICPLCGISLARYDVMRWDGTRMVGVGLTRLDSSAPERLRQLNNRAVGLARGELWKAAQVVISQTLAIDHTNPDLIWNGVLINLHAERRAAQIQGEYPLLANVFYGDYDAALELLRPYSIEELFDPKGAVVDAHGSPDTLDYEFERSVPLALTAQPDLAPAYFLRGWARYLVDPQNLRALDDIAQAAALAPKEPLYRDSLAYLR